MAGLALRPYQEDALRTIAERVRAGARRLLLSMPTGSGKTIVFSHLSERLGLGPQDRVLILAHRDELVQQAVDKYRSVDPRSLIGIEKADARAGPMERVCVASVQTLGPRRI